MSGQLGDFFRPGPITKTDRMIKTDLQRFALSHEHAFWVARVVTAGLFIAHAVVRVVNETIPAFAAFMASLGFPQAVAVVWAITVVEVLAGLCLIVRFQVIAACGALAAIALGGIVLIHRKFGWFVGEHGTGGSEYSVALLLLLFLIVVDAVVRNPRGAGHVAKA